MSKIFAILSQLILFILVFIYFSPQSAIAANCNFSYNPKPDQNAGDISVTVTSSDLRQDTYLVKFRRANGSEILIGDINFTETATFTLKKPSATGWIAGIYKIHLIEQSKSGQAINWEQESVCKTDFVIKETAEQQSCTATVPTKPIDPDTIVILQVTDLSPNGNKALGGGYDIKINGQLKTVYSTNDDYQIKLGTFNTGTYVVSVTSRCGFKGVSCITSPPRLQCNQPTFEVKPRGSGEGGQIDIGAVQPAKVCKEGDPSCTSAGGEKCESEDIDNPGIKTAIGCIHTQPAALVQDFIKFAIGIGGGLAFLMMLLGAFQMITSAGNPDTLKAGQDRLQSAIIGLLFIIFAVLLLQIIGVDILKLPGFGKIES